MTVIKRPLIYAALFAALLSACAMGGRESGQYDEQGSMGTSGSMGTTPSGTTGGSSTGGWGSSRGGM